LKRNMRSWYLLPTNHESILQFLKNVCFQETFYITYFIVWLVLQSVDDAFVYICLNRLLRLIRMGTDTHCLLLETVSTAPSTGLRQVFVTDIGIRLFRDIEDSYHKKGSLIRSVQRVLAILLNKRTYVYARIHFS